jgi:hypothetical protein
MKYLILCLSLISYQNALSNSCSSYLSIQTNKLELYSSNHNFEWAQRVFQSFVIENLGDEAGLRFIAEARKQNNVILRTNGSKILDIYMDSDVGELPLSIAMGLDTRVNNIYSPEQDGDSSGVSQGQNEIPNMRERPFPSRPAGMKPSLDHYDGNYE